MEEPKKFYDLDDLKEIPIEEICEAYGIRVYNHNNSLWFSIRNEKAPSVKIYPKTNTFCDFGDTKLSGDGIRLVAILEGIDNTKAIERLANLFGIRPINEYNFSNQYDLTDRQYWKINIRGESAFDNLTVPVVLALPPEILPELYDILSVPMSTLRITNNEIYHLLIKATALPYVKEKKNDYYRRCFTQDLFYKEMNLDILSKEKYWKELEKNKKQLEDIERIFLLAIDDKELVPYKKVKYDVPNDIMRIRSGKINFEFGNISYSEMKQSEKELAFLNVSFREYRKKSEELPPDHAVFYNRGNPKLVCFQEDLEKFEKIFQVQPKQQKMR